MADRGISLQRDPQEYWQLRRGLLRVAVEVYATEIERRSGRYPSLTARPSQELRATLKPTSNAPLLSALMDRHVSPESVWTKQTQQQNSATFRLFLGFVGDRLVDQVMRLNVSEFRDALSKLPAKWGQMPEYRGKSLREVISLAAAAGMVPGSDSRLLEGLLRVSALQGEDSYRPESYQ